MNLMNKPPLGLKKKPVKSSKIRQSAGGETCRLQIPGVCSHDPERTVLCHIRAFGIAGVGQKPPDLFSCYGCDKCHAVLDNRATWAEANLGWDDVLRAVFQTQLSLLEKGLINVK